MKWKKVSKEEKEEYWETERYFDYGYYDDYDYYDYYNYVDSQKSCNYIEWLDSRKRKISILLDEDIKPNSLQNNATIKKL